MVFTLFVTFELRNRGRLTTEIACIFFATQSQCILDLLALCDLVEINDFVFQEAFVTTEEFGQDLEHVEVLQRKFDEFLKVHLFNSLFRLFCIMFAM